MIKEKIKIPKLLYEGNPDTLSYELYSILDRHSKGYLIGDTNYGKQDLTIATKVAGSQGASDFLKDKYIEWEKPKNMMVIIKCEEYDFLDDDIEISIEVVE